MLSKKPEDMTTEELIEEVKRLRVERWHIITELRRASVSAHARVDDILIELEKGLPR